MQQRAESNPIPAYFYATLGKVHARLFLMKSNLGGPAPNDQLKRTKRLSTLGLIRLLPFVIVLAISTLSVLTVGNYLYSDTIADLSETSFYDGEIEPFVNRPPLPQLLLEAIGAVFPAASRLPAMTLMQHGFILIEVLLIGLFFKERGQHILALLVPIAWALFGWNYVLAHTTRVEPLFLFVTMIWLWLGSRWFRREDWLSAVFLGITCGLLPTVRTIGIIGVALVALAWWISPRHGGWRSTAQITVVLFTATAVILGFQAINEKRLGRFSLVDESGLHFLHRVVGVEDRLPEDGVASQKLLANAEKMNLPVFQRESVWDLRNHSSWQLGMSHQEIDDLMAQVAKEAFLERPFHFVWTSLLATFPTTKAQVVGHAIPVGLNEGYYEEHGLYWQKQDAHIAEICANFPTRNVDPIWDGMGYGILKSLSNRGVPGLTRGWWIPFMVAFLGILSLVRRDPSFVLAAGFAAGILLISCCTEAPQARFWESGELAFLLALGIGARWLYDWLHQQTEKATVGEETDAAALRLDKVRQ